MRIRAFAIVAALALGVGTRASAQPVPTPASVAETRVACAVELIVLAPSQPDEPYTVVLDSTDGVVRSGDGVVALFTATDRYDVPLPNVTAQPANKLASAVPVAVRLPSGVVVEHAFLASFSAQTCVPVVTAPYDSRAAVVDMFKRAVQAPPIDAPSPSARPATCTIADHDVAVVQATKPLGVTKEQMQMAAMGAATILVHVRVYVDEKGNPLSGAVLTPSRSAALNDAALSAALHSRYEPARLQCDDVAGTYVFVVEYALP